MSAKLEELWNGGEGSITEEQYEEGKLAIAKKSSMMGEDVVKPIAASAAALAAAAYAAPMLAAGPLGWLGYGLVVAGAALTVDWGVDNLMTADDDINEILGDESFDSEDAKKDLESMEDKLIELRNEIGDDIKGRTRNLDDEKSTSGSGGGGSIAVDNSVASASRYTNYNQVSDARNDERTIAALQAS